MAFSLGLKCSNMCWVPLHSAIADSPCLSRPTIALLRKSEHRTGFGCCYSVSASVVKKPRIQALHRSLWILRAASSEGGIVERGDFGEPISLGTMKIPTNVDLKKLESYLFQWGNSLTQSANLPLPAPLKVDRVKGGVRLGFVRVNEGKVEDLVHIDCLVFPAVEGSSPIFRALRNGQMKKETPPGEPVIMQSLLQALKKSIELSRT